MSAHLAALPVLKAFGCVTRLGFGCCPGLAWGQQWLRVLQGWAEGGCWGHPSAWQPPPSTQHPSTGANAGWLRAWVQGEAKQKTHLNTQMNLLLIFIIFTGSCKTLKNPLFMLFMTFFANLTLWEVVLHFVLGSNHRKL